MLYFLRLIGSFLTAMVVLNAVSYFIVQARLLEPEQQTKLKAEKTFWKWNKDGVSHDIHYIEKGEGSKHILLIHGFRANIYTWRFLVDPLVEAGFHVWALDLIGYGFSDKPDLKYEPILFVDQINDFMKEKNIFSAHLVGSSMGGGLSLILALNSPQRVCSLVLINALGYPIQFPLSVSFTKYLSPLWDPFFGPKMIRKGLEQLVYHPESITEDMIQAYYLPYCFPGGGAAALSTLKNFENQKIMKLRHRYPEIKCPVMVVWGENDPLIPLDHYQQFCSDFPTCQKLLIKNCGHIPHEEKPGDVVNNVIAFLQRLLR